MAMYNVVGITRGYMQRRLPAFLALEYNWTELGERGWGGENFMRELPNVWDLSFALELTNPGSLIGYLMGSTKNSAGFVNKIVVDRKFRRQGLGRKLMNAFEERCKKMGVGNVEFKALVNNTAANALYSSLGYERGETVMGTDGQVRYVYRKVLK